jgi:hypothetical protein
MVAAQRIHITLACNGPHKRRAFSRQPFREIVILLLSKRSTGLKIALDLLLDALEQEYGLHAVG